MAEPRPLVRIRFKCLSRTSRTSRHELCYLQHEPTLTSTCPHHTLNGRCGHNDDDDDDDDDDGGGGDDAGVHPALTECPCFQHHERRGLRVCLFLKP